MNEAARCFIDLIGTVAIIHPLPESWAKGSGPSAPGTGTCVQMGVSPGQPGSRVVSDTAK
jgi:hypothetical protein